jgi:hypothetical protein
MRHHRMGDAETHNLEWLIRKDGCMHCEDPGCLKACPAPGAIMQYSNAIVDFVHENYFAKAPHPDGSAGKDSQGQSIATHLAS